MSQEDSTPKKKTHLVSVIINWFWTLALWAMSFGYEGVKFDGGWLVNHLILVGFILGTAWQTIRWDYQRREARDERRARQSDAGTPA